MATHDHPSSLIIPIGLIWLVGVTIWLLSQVPVLKFIYPILGKPEYLSQAVPIFEYLHASSTLNLTLRENSHMLDVKQLLSKVEMMTAFLSGLLIFWIAIEREKLSRNNINTLFKRAIVTYILTVVVILGLGSLFWNYFFTLFHEVLFPPDTWSFPANSTLITHFPEDFWQKMATLTITMPLLKMLLAWEMSHSKRLL